MTDLRIKCTKFDFGWGSAPDPAGELYIALPRPSSWIWGPLRVRGAGQGWGREGKGLGGEVEGSEREGPKLLLNQGPEPCYATDFRPLDLAK